MKLIILAAFLFIAAVSALPVVEVKEGEAKQLVKVEGAVGVSSLLIKAEEEDQQTEGIQREDQKIEAEKKMPEDDLKTDATFWGSWGGYRSYGYGGWGGYYNPYYTNYYRSYPIYYYNNYW